MAKTTILNVDDYAPARYARSQLLRSWGFDVREAGTGAEALRLATVERPALVLLDIHLPDMSGFEVCRQLRGGHTGAALAIVHVSATFTSGAHQVLGLEGGADGYLTEPVDPAVLRATIDALLRLRQAERALVAAAGQWQATFDGIADGIAVIGHDLRVQRRNAAFARLFESVETANVSIAQLWDGATSDVPPFLRVWKSGAREVGELSRGGRWFRLTVDPVLEDGVVAGAVCFVAEITETRRMERERQHRYDDAERARAMAEAENRAKDDFLAVLGHELRTPMMPITMAVAALHARMPDVPEVARTRDIVDRQVRYLTRLVDDLLDMSRLTRSNLQLSLDRLDLRRSVADAIEATRPQLDARRHRITLQQADTPVWIDGDAVRLGQVVVNLLSNAAKFTPPEGQITVSVATEGRDAVLRVRDNGVGIGPDTLPQIFEPFTQGAHAVPASERGLGIGLALVRGLVEAHGGVVTASSPGHNRGSEFVVRLPLRSAPARTTPRTRDSQATAPARILIVEDHADSRAMLAEMLGFEGHEVIAVADGTQALAAALGSPPDVAIIDIGLHGMDGHEVARRLRQAHGASVLLIAVTGYGQAEDIEQSREAGFDAHVTKPVSPDELLDLIRRRARR